MNASLLLRVLASRQALRWREAWSRERLLASQQAALQRLREHAYARSAFYQDFHRGRFEAPLHDLPVLTKAQLMERFDDLVTDPRIRRSDVTRHVETLRGDERYLGHYWVNATSGTTGRRGLFCFDAPEWATILAAFARWYDWAGVGARLTHRRRLAAIASTAPWHMSARLSATLPGWLVPALRMDAAEPIPTIVERLNSWRPEVLVAYPSVFSSLVEEQRTGRLRVQPQALLAGSEVLTPELRRRIEAVWGPPLFNAYGVTEGGLLAAECEAHRGMHLFEDLAILEVVDRENRPVSPGAFGAKVLLTVLFSRTQPLIRYEVTDMLRLAPEPCPCGRPFALIDAVEGRQEDVLHLPSVQGGEVAVHPNLFHRILEPLPVGGWQVVKGPEGLEVRLLGEGGDSEALVEALGRALANQGARVKGIRVSRVRELSRGRTGKLLLVAEREERTGDS